MRRFIFYLIIFILAGCNAFRKADTNHTASQNISKPGEDKAPALPESAPVTEQPPVMPFKPQVLKPPMLVLTGIAGTGCSAMMPVNASPEMIVTVNGLQADFYMAFADSFTYRCIGVKLKDSLNGINNEAFLLEFLEQLKVHFAVLESKGYVRNLLHPIEKSAIGTGDVWVLNNGYSWKIRGWINNHYIGICCMGGKGKYPFTAFEEHFLNGFRFGN